MSKRDVPARWQDCRTDEQKSDYLVANQVHALVKLGVLQQVIMVIDVGRKQGAKLDGT